MNSTFPKLLLIIDEIPQSINAGSIQFYRLLESYPVDRILVIGKKPANKADVLQIKYLQLAYPLAERIHFSRYKLFLSKMEALGLVRYQLSKSLEYAANTFKPDIVLTLLQDLRYYQPAYLYTQKHKLPLCVFCHDNAENFSGLKGYFKKRLLRINQAVYNFANKRLCISPEMEEAWRKKYKTPGDVLYPIPSSNIEAKVYQPENILVTPNCVTLGFAGSLAYGYREGIKELLPILDQCNCVINIYRDDDGSISHKKIHFKGYAPTPEETWRRIARECDVLLMPYSCDPRFEELYSTHFPSKLPEYLYLGMPIIFRGPAYANGIKWVIRNGLENQSQYICTDDLSVFRGIIETLLLQKSLLKENGQKNYHLASTFFSPAQIRADFLQHINSLVSVSNNHLV